MPLSIPTLSSLVRSVLLTEALNPEESFLSYVLGSDLALGGNENECNIRKRVVARMVKDESLPKLSLSRLASIIAKHNLFKSSSASPEEWLETVRAAWSALRVPWNRLGLRSL